MSCKHIITVGDLPKTLTLTGAATVCPWCEVERLTAERDAAMSNADRYLASTIELTAENKILKVCTNCGNVGYVSALHEQFTSEVKPPQCVCEQGHDRPYWDCPKHGHVVVDP